MRERETRLERKKQRNKETKKETKKEREEKQRKNKRKKESCEREKNVWTQKGTSSRDISSLKEPPIVLKTKLAKNG